MRTCLARFLFLSDSYVGGQAASAFGEEEEKEKNWHEDSVGIRRQALQSLKMRNKKLKLHGVEPKGLLYFFLLNAHN